MGTFFEARREGSFFIVVLNDADLFKIIIHELFEREVRQKLGRSVNEHALKACFGHKRRGPVLL